MSATIAPAKSARSIVEDTLVAVQWDQDVISSGRLVVNALKNEGVDTISILGGGHIIDIYDGSVDGGVHHRQIASPAF